MSERPNILLIQCDQMIARLTGAYGHPVVETPNLNRLVEEGIRFDNAYSSCPVCVPARSSIMTGKYVSRTGCYDNGAMFPADMPTICHYLSIAGYETVASGKLHFIGPDQLHGFERRLTTDFHPSDFTFLPPRPNDNLQDHAGFHKYPIAINYVTAGIRQWSIEMDFDEETQFRALEYIRSRRSQYTGTLQRALPPREERPFFLCVSYCYPHEPFHVTQELWDIYEGKEIELPELPPNFADLEHPMDQMLNIFHGTHKVDLMNPETLYNMHRAYYGLITYVDRKVGELLEALENYGLIDNTIIMFISDHGDMLGERRMVQKRTFYEYSAQVPWIISYPSRWKDGFTVKEPVSLVDVMPTILDIAGIEKEKILPIDGNSVVPLIEGERDEERVVFAEMHSEGVNTTCFMVRQGNFKYIHTTGYDPQLYNVVQDPQEWNNLADQPDCQHIIKKLHSLLMANFDPEKIEQDVQAGQAQHWLLKEAAQKTGLPKWDYQPFHDATKRYWRDP